MSTRIAALAALVLLGAAASDGAEVSGVVTIEGRPATEAVVYLDGAAAASAGEPAHVKMDQKNLAFVPGVLAVRRGTVVEFTNSDDVQHNVFTPSAGAGRFNLGTYNRGEARSVRFDQAGEAVILCNIHMEMEGHVVVLDGPHFAVTDGAGAFRIEGVPDGSHTLRVWRRGWLPYTRAVEVGGASVRVDVEVQR